MKLDRAIELLQKARQRYGGDRDMIITVELLDDILRALDRIDRDVWREPRVHRVTPEAIKELEGTEESTLLLLRALSDRDAQKRLVRELQQQLAELRSQPRLQPVTPEAIAELEGREKTMIVHISDYDARHLSHGVNGWWEEPVGRRTPRPPSGWFIELAKLKEVQQ